MQQFISQKHERVFFVFISVFIVFNLFYSQSSRSADLKIISQLDDSIKKLKSLNTESYLSLFKKEKPTIYLFLSRKCPCTFHTREHVQFLHQTFKDSFNFVGVVANLKDKKEDLLLYFEKFTFPFPLVWDEKKEVIDLLAPRITPQAIIVDGEGHIRYSGGISSSMDPRTIHQELIKILNDKEATPSEELKKKKQDLTKQFYLYQFLLEYQEHKKFTHEQVEQKILGCPIL